MISISIFEIQTWTQRICAALSLLINAITIQLILHRSPKGIGMYRYLMIYISLFEITYAFLGVVVQPDFYSYSSVFLVIARSDKMNFPHWFLKIVNTLFCSLFGMSMATFAINFLYRYLVITGNPYVKTVSLQKLLIWIFSPISYGLVWAMILIFTLGPNESTDQILMQNFLPTRGISSIREVVYIGPNYYKFTEDDQEVLNWQVLSGMAVIMTMVSISIFTIVYFAYQCYQKVEVLNAAYINSKQYKRLQSQLLHSLVAQVLIPAVLMHGPAGFMFNLPFFHLGNEFAASLFCLSVAIYPVLDPLPTILIVQHYRSALFRFFFPNYKKSSRDLQQVTSISVHQ